jgi:hypothetical protein
LCCTRCAATKSNREFGSLEAIDDHWPKAVMVMAPSPITGRNGIRLIQLQDFLGVEE